MTYKQLWECSHCERHFGENVERYAIIVNKHPRMQFALQSDLRNEWLCADCYDLLRVILDPVTKAAKA